MSTTFLSAGLACVIAAVVGGGLKAFGIQIPVLQSLTRQVVLGLLGAILIVVSLYLPPNADKPTPSSKLPSDPHPEIVADKQPQRQSPAPSKEAEQRATTVLTLTYDGVADVLRQKDLRTTVHTPNNNENRGHCPGEIGHQDGKYCISRTFVHVSTTTPLFFQNARADCVGQGCQWSSAGPSTISPGGLSAAGYRDNWGADVDAVLLVDEYEHLPAAQCGSSTSKHGPKGTSVFFTVTKDCLQIAIVRWKRSDGSEGVLAVGSTASPGGEVVMEGSPIDHGTDLLVSYRIAK
jgi:hypothetical protein